MIKTIVIEIGIFVLSAILIAILILTTCAFVFNWIAEIKFFLILLSMSEFIVISALINEVIQNDNN